MSSRFGVPGYAHESLLLPIYQRQPQSLSGFLRVISACRPQRCMEEYLTVALTTIEANGVEAASAGALQTVLSNTGIDRRSFSRIPTVWEMPDLVQVQIESFEWFKREGLRELLEEISPISDHHKKMELTFGEYRFDEPWKRLPEHLQQQGKDDPRIVEQFCRERDITYASPLRIKAKLRVVNPETGEIREIGAGEDEDSEIFIGDFPLMTTDGTFIINGAERVVVSQLVRSPGVYFDRVDRSHDRASSFRPPS